MSEVLPASHFSQDFPIFYTKTYKERQLSLPSIHSLPLVALPNIYFSHTTDLIRQLSHTHMLFPFLNLGTYTTSYHFISRSRVAPCKELPLLDREVACSNPGWNDFFLYAMITLNTQQTFDVSATLEWRLTLTLDWRCRKVVMGSFLDVGFGRDQSDQNPTWFQRLYNVVCLLG